MIISNTLECAHCGKQLCHCVDHYIYQDKDFCSIDCIHDYIDDFIETGDIVMNEEQYEISEKEWWAQM